MTFHTRLFKSMILLVYCKLMSLATGHTYTIGSEL